MTGPSVWTIKLGILPTMSLNDRAHWAQRSADVDTWRRTVGWESKAAGIPALERPTVTLTHHAPDRRRRDPDNLVPCLKAAVDGLRDAGVLTDDTADHVDARMPVIVVDRDHPGTWTLTVETRSADG